MNGYNFTERVRKVLAMAREEAARLHHEYVGTEHILLGIDHLLFVLALIIITRGTWLLVKTVTAFTVAHSITLALATLGYLRVPSAPVEAIEARAALALVDRSRHSAGTRERRRDRRLTDDLVAQRLLVAGSVAVRRERHLGHRRVDAEVGDEQRFGDHPLASSHAVASSM